MLLGLFSSLGADWGVSLGGPLLSDCQCPWSVGLWGPGFDPLEDEETRFVVVMGLKEWHGDTMEGERTV